MHFLHKIWNHQKSNVCVLEMHTVWFSVVFCSVMKSYSVLLMSWYYVRCVRSAPGFTVQVSQLALLHQHRSHTSAWLHLCSHLMTALNKAQRCSEAILDLWDGPTWVLLGSNLMYLKLKVIQSSLVILYFKHLCKCPSFFKSRRQCQYVIDLCNGV